MIGGKGMKPEAYEDEAATEPEAPPLRTEARLEAARAALKAMKMGDAEALDAALEAHYQACSGGGAPSDEME